MNKEDVVELKLTKKKSGLEKNSEIGRSKDQKRRLLTFECMDTVTLRDACLTAIFNITWTL